MDTYMYTNARNVLFGHEIYKNWNKIKKFGIYFEYYLFWNLFV